MPSLRLSQEIASVDFHLLDLPTSSPHLCYTAWLSFYYLHLKPLSIHLYKRVNYYHIFLLWNFYLRWWLNGFASFSGRPFLTAFFFCALGLLYSFLVSIRFALTLSISSSLAMIAFLFDLKQHPILFKKFLII